MKRALAVLLAILLSAALFPAALAGGGGTPRSAVVYSGETVSAVGLAVGGTFDWKLSVSDASRLFSGHWLVDFPDGLVTPVSASTTFAGSLTNTLNSSNTSDKAAFVYNLDYAGQTGSVPCGMEGNHYTNVGMYLTSFTHGGVQPGGAFIRITFRLNRMPTEDELMEDYLGSFFTIPVTVVESNYFVSGASIAPDSEYALPHEDVSTVIGKVYVTAAEPSDTHTVRFFGYNNALLSTQQVPHGQAASAPSAPDVTDGAGLHRFFAWDADFSNVTSDLDVHAEYVLLGDADLNGQVNVQDALLTLRGAMNLVSLTAKQRFAADVDSSGAADMNDALKILRFAMGLINTF